LPDGSRGEEFAQLFIVVGGFVAIGGTVMNGVPSAAVQAEAISGVQDSPKPFSKVQSRTEPTTA
jgi:hypothetical protein